MTSPVERLNQALADRYRLGGELGRGGMASVYRADDLRHGREVAIKVILPDFLGDEGLRRFEAEIRMTAVLHHPNILPLFDSGRVDDHLFYVMPVVTGESLQERLDREGALPAHEAGRIAAAAGRALGYAHAHGIVHRDVKPSNLLLHLGETLVADFGISRVMGSDDRLTATGLSLGTPHYMSPEQLTDASGIDGRSDQYALACVLYEMLAGHPPFPKRSAHAVLAAHLTQSPPALTLRGEEALALARVVERALAKAPDKRFPSMEAFVEAVEEAIAPRTAGAVGGRQGLVVLPFTNLSGNPEDEYFSDGLTEEVIGDLSRIQGLRVISRTTAMQYKRTTLHLAEIARELAVPYALEGSVRRAGNRLRVSAQLIETATEEHLWSNRFDGVLDDVFEIQDQVSTAIADALSIALTASERQAIRDRRLPDAEALELVLRARQAANSFNAERIDASLAELQGALDGRDDHIQLLFGLGYLHYQAVNVAMTGGDRHYAAIQDVIQRMETLQPGTPYAAFLRGLRSTHGRLPDALRYFLSAYEGGLHRDEDVIYWLSAAFIFLGQGELADRFQEEFLTIAPNTTRAIIFNCMRDQYRGRWADALAAVGAVRSELGEASPTFVFMEAWTHAAFGVSDEKVVHLMGTRADVEGDGFAAMARMLKAVHAGRPDDVLSVPGESLSTAWDDAQYAAWVADIYAGAGARDQAMRWLERAVDLGFLLSTFMAQLNPYLAGLRDDPDFKALMRRAQLEQVRLGAEFQERVAGWDQTAGGRSDQMA